MDNNRSVNIQQLKEMHTKLQNLNSNVTSAITKSKEFHTKLEGQLQDSLSKLQQNLDSSINTDRVQQSEKLLMDIHTHFEVKCTQIEEQNLNLVNRLRQMEKQEENYKNQITNLNQLLNQKGLKAQHLPSASSSWINQQQQQQLQQSQQSQQLQYSYDQKEYSFGRYNNNNNNLSNINNSNNNQFDEDEERQKQEQEYLRNEINKLNKEIELLLQEKKNIMEQQYQNQQYLQDHQNSYYEQLYQSDLSTGSKAVSKANPINVSPCKKNDLTNVTKMSSPQKTTNMNRKSRPSQLENYDSNIEEQVSEGGRNSPQHRIPKGIINDQGDIRLISPLKSQIRNNNSSISSAHFIHHISPSKLNFNNSNINFNKKSHENNNNNNINQSNQVDEEKMKMIKEEIEQRLQSEYEYKLQQANQLIQIQRDTSLKQTEELLRERDVRIQMQLKLEEIEAEKRFQTLLKSNENINEEQNNQNNHNNNNNNQNNIITPIKKIQENNSSVNESSNKHNQNTLAYSSATEQYSPIKQLSNHELSSSKFQPIHTTLKLNKLNPNNNNNNNNNNENNYSYEMSVSPNKSTAKQQNYKSNNNEQLQQLSSSSSKSNSNTQQENNQIQQQLIQIISKLQTTMNNKKKNMTPIKEQQKQIEVGKRFEDAIEDKLYQLKTVLSQEQTTINRNDHNDNDESRNIITTNSHHHQSQTYQYNASPVYTSEFNSHV